MVPNGESGDKGNKGNIIPFPITQISDPEQGPNNVASWLELEVLKKLQVASAKFNNSRLKPKREDISDAAAKVTEVIDSIFEAMELIDELEEDSQQPLMSIWTRLENENDGILKRLDMIGAELINLDEASNLDSAKKIELDYGQRVQDVRTNFRKVERDLKNFIKQLRSICNS